MKLAAVRATPLALSAFMFAWTVLDIASSADVRSWPVWAFFLAVAVFSLEESLRTRDLFWERASRLFLAVAFFGERLFLTGPDTLPMLGFLVMLMSLSTLQSMDRMFAGIYRHARDSALIARVDSAAARAYVRLLGLLGFTFAASYVLALVVPLAGLQTGNLFVAFGLATVLLLIVTRLALAPSVRIRRQG